MLRLLSSRFELGYRYHRHTQYHLSSHISLFEIEEAFLGKNVRLLSRASISHATAEDQTDLLRTGSPAECLESESGEGDSIVSSSPMHSGNGGMSRTRHDHPQFGMQSKRRLPGSPTLPLEAVAISKGVQESILENIRSSGFRPKHLRKKISSVQMYRARETYRDKMSLKLLKPYIVPPPQYNKGDAASFASIRFPGTFASNVHVLAEVRRILPYFSPSSLLDFGAGVGTSLLAVSRVMSSPSISQHSKLAPHLSENIIQNRVPHMSVKHAWLIEQSSAMQALASSLLSTDVNIADKVDVLQTKSLSEGPQKHKLYDLVCASYSFGEIVRSTINRSVSDSSLIHEEKDPNVVKQKVAEMRLRKLVRSLWRRVAPGGVFIAIEDGTAAGFEAVLFSRELLLSNYGSCEENLLKSSQSPALEDSGLDDEELTFARVVAPCIHSKRCPLDGSVTRHRICRFVQRLNRPPVQREAYPQHNAFEDEYFSYIAIQKVISSDIRNINDIHGDQWGRLIRSPLRRRKHISFDACTRDAELERRTVTKKSAEDGYFPLARRSRWGDIWPVPPANKAKPVNF